jgi:endonuclease YncB( thermonuclease family)
MMFLDPRLNTPMRTRLAAMLPRVLLWVLIFGVAVSSAMPWRTWRHHLLNSAAVERPWPDSARANLWGGVGQSEIRHPVEVLRMIDGDTFVARVSLKPGFDIVTHVRLRGIDAPELKAACAKEARLAEAATEALRGLLADGNVTIFNVGPDKYAGRVDADVATSRTANVSNALLSTGKVRRYDGGRRSGWCLGGWR